MTLTLRSLSLRNLKHSFHSGWRTAVRGRDLRVFLIIYWMVQWSWKKSKTLEHRSTDLHFPSMRLKACIQTCWVWWNNVGLNNRLRDLLFTKSPNHWRPSTKESRCYIALHLCNILVQCSLEKGRWKYTICICFSPKLMQYAKLKVFVVQNILVIVQQPLII